MLALSDLAARIVWFEPPAKALSDTPRFLAYAMRYASAADMAAVRKYFGDDVLRESLDLMPPGIIDPRSWSYWNVILGRYPPPPMPMRRLPD